MSTQASIIATARVRPGVDAEFTNWKAHHDRVIGKFPGFLSSDIIPPTQPGSREWTIIVNFRSKEDLVVWQKSSERAQVVAAGLALFEGGNFGEVVQTDDDDGAIHRDTTVTEVIFTKIKPGNADTYREWGTRMQSTQAKYPGYKGTFLQPPAEEGGFWTTIMRFDSAAHLETWMNSAERKEMLNEAMPFIEHAELTRLTTSFPGWAPTDSASGRTPPNWKVTMLVLLGLYPIVCLEILFLMKVFARFGLKPAFAGFLGNAISVTLVAYGTMPLLVRWMNWWLLPKPDAPKTVHWKGTFLVCAIYALAIAVFWKFL